MTRINLLLCLILVSGWGLAQSPMVDVSVGGQRLDVSGNENVYRSQENEDDGLVLQNLALTLFPDKSGWLKTLKVNASGFGGRPDGHLKVQLDHPDFYSATFQYRRFDVFHALPGITNVLNDPLAGQHRTDDTREVLSFDLELLPKHKLRPLLSYRQFGNDGDFTTTTHLGQDDFLLNGRRDEDDREIQAGLRYVSSKLTAEAMVGQRDYEGEESLISLASAGNNSNTIFGNDIHLDALNRFVDQEMEADTSRVSFRYAPISNLNITGYWIKANPEMESSLSDDADGMLAGFDISRFYRDLSLLSRSNTEQDFTASAVRAEGSFGSMFEWSAGLSRRELDQDGRVLLDAVYLDTVTFGGAQAGSVTREAVARTHLEEEEEGWDLELAARPMKGLRLWLGFADVDRDTILDEDPLQIVVTGGQEGLLERRVETWTLGAAYRHKGFHGSLIYRSRDADTSILRTDYQDRDELKLKFNLEMLEGLVLHGSYQSMEAENPTPGIDLDMERRDAQLNVNWRPNKTFELTLGLGDSSFESLVVYRDPFFDPAQSAYEEEDTSLFLAAELNQGRFTLKGSLNDQENDGMQAYELDHLRFSVAYKLNDALDLEAMYRDLEYTEAFLPVADYQADVLGFFIHWRK